MDTSNLDIIYLLKDSAYNDELKYSLRSVEQNFPHRKVWFVGGRPTGLVPDERMTLVQKEKTKYDRTHALLKQVCENDKITEDFVLFNDDFFVMKPWRYLPSYVSGTLEGLIGTIELTRGKPSPYTERLKDTVVFLEKTLPGQNIMNYELHIPMIFNRKQLRNILKQTGFNGVRSIYGNTFYYPKSLIRKDVKIYDQTVAPDPDADFLSTTDLSFSSGLVGNFIKQRFPSKSRFER